jgi:hypothetical protein
MEVADAPALITLRDEQRKTGWRFYNLPLPRLGGDAGLPFCIAEITVTPYPSGEGRG